MDLNASIKQITEEMKERNTKHYGFVRYLLLMASGLFGVLISFHTKDNIAVQASICLQVSLGLIGLGVLFGAMFLFREVHEAKHLVKDLVAELQNSLSEQREQRIVSVKAPLIFRIFEIACYVSFIFAVLMLISYSFFRLGFSLHTLFQF